jgi:hypothetical protein
MAGHGYVQMLEGLELQGLLDNGIEGLDDLGDLGASEPPAILAATISALVQSPEVKRWLRSLGHYIAKKGIGEFKEMVFGRPTPPSPWMAQLVDPWLDEIEEGILEVLKSKARPWAWGLAVVTGLAGVGLGALVAGRKRKLYTRAQEEALARR